MKPLFLPLGAIALAMCSAATAEQLFNENVVIDGNLCVGPDCSSGNASGSLMGIILKADTPALRFDSPNSTVNEWTLSASATSGGAQAFGILSNRVTGGARMSFQISGSAPASAFIIDDLGEIGFGTTFPAQDLHIIKPLAPAIRLEQDTSGGQPSHTWDMSAGNSGFQIADVGTPFSTVPFTIENGADPGAFHIDATGTVGLGTTTPSTGLHVWDNTGQGAILIEETSAGTLGQMTLRNNGITFFTLEDTSIAAGNNTGRAWNFQNQAGTFRVTTAPGGPGEIEMIMTPAGDMTIKGSLTTGGGTCGGGCDAVFSDDYDLPSITEHAEAMWSLGHLPNVGPTVENEPINISDKLGRMLNELEHAHIYIAELEARDRARQEQMTALTARLDALDSQ